MKAAHSHELIQLALIQHGAALHTYIATETCARGTSALFGRDYSQLRAGQTAKLGEMFDCTQGSKATSLWSTEPSRANYMEDIHGLHGRVVVLRSRISPLC